MSNKRVFFIINALVVLGLLLLPYYLFEGRLFIGGDDSRLLYVFPSEFLRNISFFSWFHFSAVGSNNPNQFLMPLLAIFALLKLIIGSVTVLSYLAFSLPLVIGFIYFQKTLALIISDSSSYRLEIFLGSCLYIFSPILIIGQLINFLYSAWLIALFPVATYYFVKYLRTGRFRYVVLNVIWCTVLALALYSVPWLLGIILPLAAGLAGILVFFKKSFTKYVVRAGIFIGVTFVSQAFWLVPFGVSLISSASFGSKALSTSISDTFAPTVLATSKGSVVYPLLDLFHRQIGFDFNWALTKVYLGFYDHLAWMGLIFPLLLVVATVGYRRYLKPKDQKVYLVLWVAFLVSLFLFTVNIGFLKNIFLGLGKIPGFAMFRNPADKFALGYIIIYAALLTFSLVALRQRLAFKYYRVVVAVVVAVVGLYALPVKELVNRPLWTTKAVSTTMKLPQEYLDFTQQIKSTVPQSAGILSLPFGVASYSFVKEDGAAGGVYAGRSPVQLLTGVNDFSGSMSFPSDASQLASKLIQAKQYFKLRNLLSTHNVSYVVVTKNIPSEVLSSYLFNKSLLDAQDSTFKDKMLGKKLITSQNGNYELYEVKNDTGLRPSLVAAPSTVFQVPNHFLKDSNSLESLMAISNPGNVFAENVGSDNLSRQVYPLHAEQTASIAAGNYTMYTSTKTTLVLNYDAQNKSLKVQSGANYRLGSVLQAAPSTKVADLAQDDMIGVDNKMVEATALMDYPVSRDSKITVYQKTGSEVTPSASEILKTWYQLDCNAYNNKPEVEFGTTGNKNDTLVLTGINQHRACLSKDVATSPNSMYRLEFDYYADAEELYLSVNGKEVLVTSKTSKGAEFRHFTYSFNSSGDSIPLYLYSGKGKYKNVTSYKNFSLRRYRTAGTAKLTDFLDDKANIQHLSLAGPGKLALDISPKELPHQEYGLDQWERSDCAAINNKPAVFFASTGDGFGADLAAADGHNACISQKLTINPGAVYRVQYDYYSNTPSGKKLYVGYQSGGEEFAEEFNMTDRTNGWERFSSDIAPPRNADSMRLFLYSGTNLNGEAETKYRNVHISYIPKIYYNVLLAEDPAGQDLSMAKLEFTATSPVKNHVKSKSLSKPFMLTLNDSFNTGWKLYLRPIVDAPACSAVSKPTTASTQSDQTYVLQTNERYKTVADRFKVDYAKLLTYNNVDINTAATPGTKVLVPPADAAAKPVVNGSSESVECKGKTSLFEPGDLSSLWQRPVFDDKHIKVNGFSNGWMIDPAYVKSHFSNQYYRENSDGSIELNIVMYFKPQSFFYVGVIVSGVTLLASLGYLGYTRRRRRPK